MSLALTDVQLALAESIRDWAARAHPVDAVRSGDAGAVEKVWRGLADIGVFGIPLEVALGGLDGTADDADRKIYAVDMRMPLALVLGAEGDGMRRLTRETCDQLVTIPMLGSVQSLNVSVASGVCLFEAVRQRRS